jgi:hypothetical protein
MTLDDAMRRMPSAEATSPAPRTLASASAAWADTISALAAAMVSGRMKFCLTHAERYRRRAGTSCRLTGPMPMLRASAISAAHRLVSKCSTLACRSLR